MASEYVSYMLMFGLGISMVIGITITMQNITTTVHETSAEVEFDSLIDTINNKLYELHSSMVSWQGDITFDYNLDLPRLLVGLYYYNVYIIQKAGSYYLVGNTTSSENIIQIEKLLLLTPNEVSISGMISSTRSNPYISLHLNTFNQISIILGNN